MHAVPFHKTYDASVYDPPVRGVPQPERRATAPRRDAAPARPRLNSVASATRARRRYRSWSWVFALAAAPFSLLAGLVSTLRGRGFQRGFFVLGSWLLRRAVVAEKQRPLALRLEGLNGAERTAAEQIGRLLTRIPLPTDYKKRTAILLDGFGSEARAKIGHALGRTRIYLPSLRTKAPASEDASARIRYVYMASSPEYAWQQAYVDDMISVGEKEGFSVVVQSAAAKHAGAIAAIDAAYDKDDIWMEDNKWFSSGDDVQAPVRLTTLTRAVAGSINRARALARGFEASPAGMQGAVDWRREQARALALGALVGRDVRTITSYNEGGNMLTGVMPDGEPYAIVGRDALFVSALQTMPDAATLDARSVALDPAPSSDELARMANALGTTGMANSPQDALRMFARLELAKEALCSELGVAREHLCVIAQPEFHIDLAMHPVAPGVVWLNDDRACVKLLDEAIATAKRDSADAWQIPILESMRQRSCMRVQERGALMAQIKSQLLAQGLRVVSAPGVMETSETISRRYVNFMNAVPGTGRGNSGIFYCTNATSLSALQSAFEAFAKRQGVDRVHFLGSEGGSATTPSASEISLGFKGGLDCLENHHEGLRM